MRWSRFEPPKGKRDERASASLRPAARLLLARWIQYVAQRMMDMDVESLCAAGYAKRSPERLNSRNGYRKRLWETRAGSVDLQMVW
jgi:transposase-like protein